MGASKSSRRLLAAVDEVAHAAAEEVPPRALVLHVIVDLGDGGVRALSVVELFVARGSQELHLRLGERRERARGGSSRN